MDKTHFSLHLSTKSAISVDKLHFFAHLSTNLALFVDELAMHRPPPLPPSSKLPLFEDDTVAAGQDLAPQPRITRLGCCERSPSESYGALRRSARCRQER